MTSEVPDASPAEIDALGSAWASCLSEQAVILDDGVSDSKTVASAVASACEQDANALYDARTRGRQPNYREQYRQSARAGEVDVALSLVLRARRAARR